MKQALLWIGVSAIIVAFIVGSWKGDAGDKKEAADEEAAQKFLRFKQYTSKSVIDRSILQIIADLYPHPLTPGSAEQKKRNEIIKGAYKSYQPTETLNVIGADIYHAKSIINDNETKCYAALSRLTCLVDLWALDALSFEIAVRRLNETKVKLTLGLALIEPLAGVQPTNVIDFIDSFLNNEEKAKCTKFLETLPLFIAGGKKYYLPKEK